LGVHLDGGRAAQLDVFEELLRDRAVPLGMVAASDAGRLRERHLVDCLRAATAVDAEDRRAYDLGSGAGLPGVVVAIACPGLEVVLVEPKGARAAFLELVVERLALFNARVFASGAESLEAPVDVCFSRAFSDARSAWSTAERLLRPTGRLVYFAGASFAQSELPAGVRADIRTAPSLARSGPLVIMTRQ
jgi:16S rRNA (guanine527-N7)-methyltransferase